MNSASSPFRSSPLHWLVQRWPGLTLSAAVAMLASWLGDWPAFQAHGISALTLAIVLGMLVGNTVYRRVAPRCAPGVSTAKQTLLRAGIVLYGWRLTFQDIAHVGVVGVIIDAVMLLSTFGLAVWLGRSVFKLDSKTAVLIGAGSSICGAAAVMATEPVVQGRAEQVTIAVSTVVVFGTLAIFVYPALYHLDAATGWFALQPQRYGVFVGSTVHEVAQVVAAGRAIDQHAADVAVIVKMVRVMMLAPFLVALSALGSRRGARHGDRRPRSITVPWFAFGFVAVAVLNSCIALPPALTNWILKVDTAVLAMAMAALGVTTHWGALRSAGVKPLLLGAVLALWLVFGGLMVNNGITHALS
ncbi:MAG: YeiH family protein [Rhodocyclaceae bacterium]